jgi:hypothetical protein
MKTQLASSVHFASSVIAFVVSVYAFSNLMSVILEAAGSGMNFVDGALIAEYLVITSLAILVLAKEIYRLDQRAGRIRNRIRWFE